MFKKVLIANRGEIAVRIAITLRKMGIEVAAVYSDADGNSPHLLHADEAYPLSGVNSAETYLSIEKIMAAAVASKADAIHPGYGFLSENPAFAQACAEKGIVFIGPSADVLKTMGDKLLAKRIAEKAGVPVIPAWPLQGSAGRNDLAKAAKNLGYPVVLKATAGGGGKGIRLVSGESELQKAFDEAEQEARNAFGDSRIFLEKYFERCRHIEVQIFGDHNGNVVHLFERECSLQRRHQKILEESPCATLSFQQRKRIGEAAVRIAKAVEYANAGTIEFLLDAAGNFYFLEMNPRLQVEHTLTEMTLRQDLVRAQVQVACGETLPFYQATVKPEGHAIECRIYAEDPANNFLPSTGKIETYAPPSAPEIRVDSGVEQGSVITPHYDALLAKLIAWGRSRLEAIKTMQWALQNFVILGVSTNLEFLQGVVSHPKFLSEEIHTKFLEEREKEFLPTEPVPQNAWLAAAFAAASKQPEVAAIKESSDDPWLALPGWRAF